MKKKVLTLVFVLLLGVSFVRAQTAEVTIQLNEQFFDALLEAIFKNTNPPEFPLSENNPKFQIKSPKHSELSNSFIEKGYQFSNSVCQETIKLQRQINGVNTAVRFRDGKIFAPIAFTGNYNPPLIGCIDFSGWAETNIELAFDREKQSLVGFAKVLNVNLSGTGGVGGSLIARLVQSSIDKKINPIQILQMDKVSFVVPIQNAGSLRMKAVGMRHEVGSGFLNVHINYEFQKAE